MKKTTKNETHPVQDRPIKSDPTGNQKPSMPQGTKEVPTFPDRDNQKKVNPEKWQSSHDPHQRNQQTVDDMEDDAIVSDDADVEDMDTDDMESEDAEV